MNNPTPNQLRDLARAALEPCLCNHEGCARCASCMAALHFHDDRKLAAVALALVDRLGDLSLLLIAADATASPDPMITPLLTDPDARQGEGV